MPPFSTTAINENSNAAVVVAGFCINQLPAFPLPALRPTLRNILDAIVILFYFFSKSVFPYKTPENVFEYVELLLVILKFVGFIFPPNVIQRLICHICC